MSDNHFKYDFTSTSLPGEQINPFRLELKSITRSLMARITPKMADLLDLVMAVYAADRQSRRSYKGMSTGQREFLLRLALREPEFWKRPELLSHLQSYLNWVSEDVWAFEFVSRDAPPTWAESELFLLDNLPERPTTVSLFSGGLDSLGGLFAHRQDRRSGSHVLVSVTHTVA